MSGLLIAAGTTTTNPDPNSLTTFNPYPTPYINHLTPSAAWIAQLATKSDALIRSGSYDRGITLPGYIRFQPSTLQATFKIATWVFDPTLYTSTPQWFLMSLLESARLNPVVQDTYFASYPPSANHPTEYNFNDMLVAPPATPIYIQIVSLSAGTLQITYDDGIFDRVGLNQPL